MQVRVVIFRLLLCVVLSICCSGCETVRGAKTNHYSKGWAPLKLESKIRVFPISSVYGVDVESLSSVNDALVKEMAELGHEVEWPKETLSEREPNRFPGILGVKLPKKILLEKFYMPLIVNNPNSDIYIFPLVVKKLAKLEGKLVKWDGVNHTLVMVGGSGIGTWSGQQPTYSIRLEIFDKTGKWLMTSFGGVSVPVYAHIASRELRKKESLFSNDKDYRGLLRGVAKALQPLKIRK